jgi:flagellar basal-body rod protein FlgF/flagellar basal-body rod protein FlgG
LADFAPETLLTPEGNSYFVAPAGSEQPAADASVRQGTLEASNLNVVEGAVGLIILQRHAETLQRALSLFHNEFNRIAVEDLPRI